jgi:predicted amino acid racemase
VTKVLCGHAETLKALQMMGVQSMGDSRLMNLRAIERIAPDCESWYLRLPHLSVIEEIISQADVSLNSEIEIIKALNEEAKLQGKTHRIIIMIELGDLREGILPGTLIRFYEQVFDLSNIEVFGIGANLGCLAGAIPNIDQFTQLALYRELLELKFGHTLPLLSAGSSAVLPMTLEERLPKGINHFRIGESIFLGSDLVNGGTLEGLRDDVVMLEGEIAEIKEKSLVPLGETSNITPFESTEEEDYSPGQRGFRALVMVGQVDTDIAGITPEDDRYHVAGASSDITVVNLNDNPEGLAVGDSIRFSLSYSAFLRAMVGKYIDIETYPGLEEFDASFSSSADTAVAPVLSTIRMAERKS